MNPLEEVMTAAEAAERWGKAPITVQPLFLQGVQVILGRDSLKQSHSASAIDSIQDITARRKSVGDLCTHDSQGPSRSI